MEAAGQAARWRCTGLHWEDDRPVLGAVRGGQRHRRVVEPGAAVAWRVGGPRRCSGPHLPGEAERRACPHRAEIDPAGGAVLCPPCQQVDAGLALARDRILDDGRTYRLYLAWFGGDLLKVGLTGELRGRARLLEQGAPVFTFLARGPLPAVRRAELTVSGSGLARERFGVRAKAEQWWHLPGPQERHARVVEARAAALRLLAGHPLTLYPDGPVVDHVELFGLAEGPPRAYREVLALADGATISGTLRPPVGRQLFLEQPDGGEPLLLDARRLTGWALQPADAGASSGLDLRPHRRPPAPDAQGALF
ncbi:DUF2797 domain-containing protein [Kitasatospora sp. NPDC059571]|uniref:DUF2797 domain-containing protein n=1 Tax=Kitasatospora sp. NPDC059571 TaxID=3346871 RepID=UPI0036A322CE